MPCFVVDAAGVELLLAKMAAEERLVVLAGDEADFLAVLLFGDFEADGAGDVANLGLGHGAEGHEGVQELLLAQGEEEIALVLARVAAFAEDGAVVLRHAR